MLITLVTKQKQKEKTLIKKRSFNILSDDLITDTNKITKNNETTTKLSSNNWPSFPTGSL